MIDHLVAAGIDAAVACHVLRVSRSGFYAWKNRPPSQRARVDEQLTGDRLHQAGLLGSMGRVASSVDNGLMESFWSTKQRELLDQRVWESRDELGQAIFEWIETWHNPRRRHSGIRDVSPLEFENTHQAALAAQFSTHNPCPRPGSAPKRQLAAFGHGSRPAYAGNLWAIYGRFRFAPSR